MLVLEIVIDIKNTAQRRAGPGLQGSSVAGYGLRVLGLRVYGRRWRGAYGASGLAGRECLRFYDFRVYLM